MGRSMADRNRMLISISKSGNFQKSFSGFELLTDNDGNPVLISDKGGTSDVYGIRKTGEQTKYVLKVIGLKNSVIKSDGRRNFADEIMASVKLQSRLSEKCENIIPIEKADVFALKYDEEGNFTGTEAVETADDASEIAAFIIMKEYTPIVENKGQTGGSVCHIPLLNTYDAKEGYSGDKRGVLYLAYDIAKAVNTIHTYKNPGDENSIAHRDIKPENIFYDEETSRFLLGDFGLARITDSNSASTCAGTRGFAAPEISLLNTENGESYDALKADIYSFGMTMFVLLNELAFPGGRSGSYSNMNSNFFPTDEKNSMPPCDGFGSVNSLISGMIKIKPEERNTTSGDVLEAVRGIFSDEFPGEREKLENSEKRSGELKTDKATKAASIKEKSYKTATKKPHEAVTENPHEGATVDESTTFTYLKPVEADTEIGKKENKEAEAKRPDSVKFSYLKSTEENGVGSDYYKPEAYSSQIPVSKADPFQDRFHKKIVTRKMRMPLLLIPAVLLPLLFYVESFYAMSAKVNGLFIASFVFAAIASACKLEELINPANEFEMYYGFSIISGIVSLILVIISIVMGADTGLSVLIFMALAFLTAYLNEYSATILVSILLYIIITKADLAILQISHYTPAWIFITLMALFATIFSSKYYLKTKGEVELIIIWYLAAGLITFFAGVVIVIVNIFIPMSQSVIHLHLWFVGLVEAITAFITYLSISDKLYQG